MLFEFNSKTKLVDVAGRFGLTSTAELFLALESGKITARKYPNSTFTYACADELMQSGVLRLSSSEQSMALTCDVEADSLYLPASCFKSPPPPPKVAWSLRQ